MDRRSGFYLLSTIDGSKFVSFSAGSRVVNSHSHYSEKPVDSRTEVSRLIIHRSVAYATREHNEDSVRTSHAVRSHPRHFIIRRSDSCGVSTALGRLSSSAVISSCVLVVRSYQIRRDKGEERALLAERRNQVGTFLSVESSSPWEVLRCVRSVVSRFGDIRENFANSRVAEENSSFLTGVSPVCFRCGKRTANMRERANEAKW